MKTYLSSTIPAFLAVAVALCSACGARLGAWTRDPPPSWSIWFEDLSAAPAVDADRATALARRALERLRGREPGPGAAGERTGAPAPRMVFLSISDGRGPARVALGAGRGLEAAVDHAARRLRDRHRGGPGPGARVWLKLDVVAEVGPALTTGWDDPLPGERSLQGLAFARHTGLAFVAEELVAHRLMTAQGWLRRARMAAQAVARGLAYRGSPLRDPDAVMRVRRFTTRSFFFDGRRARALYRGHLADQAVTPARLGQAVAAGARYLQRAVDDQGRFVYAYLAKRDRPRDRYNMVRHAGTVFAMLQAWQRLGDPALLAAAERAIAHMNAATEPFGAADRDMAVLAYGGKIKLGGVALAALALTTHARVTGASTHLARARRLCRYILASQRADGSFLHQRHHPGGEPRDFVSQYYPGEAVLALVTLHHIDPDPAWLDAAEAGARYLIEVRDRDVADRDLPPDHWLLYALERLYRLRPRPVYLEHAMRLAQSIMDAQNTDAAIPDLVGSYHDPPRATPVATRTEGLMAAYRLARHAGRPRMARAILDAARLGARVQLATLIDPPRAMYLPNPRAALGGVTRSYTHFEVRIDYVQHTLSALLALMDALPPGPP